MRLLFIINSLKWPVFTHLYTMCCKCKYPFHVPCWSVLIQPSVNIYAFATICNLKSEYAVQIESVLLAVVMEIQQLDSLEVIQRSDGKRLKMRTCNTGLNVESTRSLAGPTGNKCAWVCAPSEKIMSIVRCRGCFLIPPFLSFSFLLVPPSAPRGVWPRRRRPAGWGAQHSRCGCSAEGVPQGHARPSFNQGALHGLHQHHM